MYANVSIASSMASPDHEHGTYSDDARSPEAGDVTALLHAASRGDKEALSVLYSRLYDELHQLAHHVRCKQAGQTLNTTALIHEAYLKLFQSKPLHIKDRLHFYRLSARVMRQVLVNAAEKQRAQKRGGAALHITFDEQRHNPLVEAEDVLALHEALKKLERLDPRQSQVVEYRFFGGLNIRETADVLGISVMTANRDWRTARAWLTHAIKHQHRSK